MLKRIVIITILMLFATISGCSIFPSLGSTAEAAKPSILRKAEVSGKWQVYQLHVEVAPAMDVPILLRLPDGAKVDGYFYLEKGSNVGFQITGNSAIYKSEPPAGSSSGKVNSDRFTFSASQAQGMSYILTFHNPGTGDEATKITVFVELVYPSTGDIYIELENK